LRGIEHRELPFSSLPRQQGTALRLGLLSLGHHIKELDDHHEPLRRGACRIEGLQKEHSAPGVKQQLAAVRMLFDWLITGQVLPTNPAAAVRGPKHVVKTGSTPVLEGAEWRKLLKSIPDTTLRDLRDRADRHAYLQLCADRRGLEDEGRGFAAARRRMDHR
jgi:hypothetical protein